MENLCVLTQKEKLELESIVEILLSVHLDFESATDPDEFCFAELETIMPFIYKIEHEKRPQTRSFSNKRSLNKYE